MQEVRSARSFSFRDEGDGNGRWVFALEDGTCLIVSATASQAALGLSQISDFVAKNFQKP